MDDRFCPACGTAVQISSEDMKLGVVHDQRVLYCPICGRAVSPTDHFRCPVCKREHLCTCHLMPNRVFAAGEDRLVIPTCCEECSKSLVLSNASIIKRIKEARRCAKCKMMNCRYQCRVCGRYYCGRHADRMCKEHRGQYTYFVCHNCGVVCEKCARGGKKCRRCGELVRPADRAEIDRLCPPTDTW